MRGSRRFRFLPTLTVSLLTSFVGAALAITTNLASNSLTLPSPLSWFQRHPLASSGVLVIVMFGLWAVGFFVDQAGPQPATADDLAQTGERIHDQLDRIELSQLQHDDRVLERLPPYARQLLDEDVDHDSTWQLVVAFTRDSADPIQVGREWAVVPPKAAAGLSAYGQLVIAELMLAYGQPDAAVTYLRAALSLGVSPRPFWLFRAAQAAWTVDDNDSALAFLEEAQRVDATYPLTNAARLNYDSRWGEAEAALSACVAQTAWERDATASLTAVVCKNLDRTDEAIRAIETVADSTASAGLLLHLARLLARRSVTGAGDSQWKDAARARDLAIRARNLRRSWRGDSAEAIATAAEALFIGEDPAGVWAVTRPAPDGDATDAEAADSRVLAVAALGAALTGRVELARLLANETDETFVKLQVDAEILSIRSGGNDRDPVVAAWLRVAEAASTDEQQLRALRFLALEGATHEPHAEALRSRYPGAVAEIESIREISSITGPGADARLRGLEATSSLATVRRAELFRAVGEPGRAAEVLLDAMQRWHDPRLLLLALDCHMDDGDWPRARSIAQQALTESGLLWPGRTTVLRRLADVDMTLHDWPGAVSACRALLELDDRDDDARWILAYCQARDGDPAEAWRTLQRHGEPRPTTPTRARFLLDLVRRFCDAAQVARTALSLLHAFPDDEAVHLEAMNAINTRIDRTDLPKEIGQEVTEAWTLFFERYPASTRIQQYSLADNILPADMEAMMRAHAATYQATRDQVKNDLLPIGLLSPVVGKPYAAIFPYRPLGMNRIASPVEQDVDVELAHARAVHGQACIIDASTLYTLTLIPDAASALLGIVGRTLTTAAGLTDLLAADDYFALPAAGTMGFDPDADRFFATETDPDVRRRQQQQISAMLSHGRGMRRIGHSSLVHLPSWTAHDELAWLLNVDAAKDTGSFLWCDDLGLRRLAHGLGVRTFGTVSMLDVAAQLGLLDETARRSALHALTAEYTVDLPFDQGTLMSVGAAGQWQLGPVTTILGRPATWTQPEPAAAVLRTALRATNSTAVDTWIHQALLGLQKASTPEHGIDNLTHVSTALACELWAQPRHIAGIVRALAHLAPEDVGHIVETMLRQLWAELSKRHKPEEAVLIMTHLIGDLEDGTRQRAMRLMLQVPKSGS